MWLERSGCGLLVLVLSRIVCRGRTPLPEGEGRVSWADSTAGGRGPRVVGGLHCRRERAECRGQTPLPEGEGRIEFYERVYKCWHGLVS